MCDKDKTYFMIECCLIDIPSSISVISVCCNLTLKEINTTHSELCLLTKHNNKSALKRNKKLFDFQALNTFTFEVEITVMNIFDTTHNNILLHYLENNCINIPYKLPLINYQWKINNLKSIKDANKTKNMCQFYSTIFKIWKGKWIIRLFLKEGDLHLYLCLLSLSKEISHIRVGFKFKIKANGITISKNNIRLLGVVDFKIGSSDWGNKNVLKMEDIMDYDNIVIDVDMVILNIYYKDSEKSIITNYFQNYINTFAKEVPSVKCKWCITDSNEINKMKTCKEGERFKSSIFNINVASTKWQLNMYPNGDSSKHKGYIGLFLNLVSLSKNVSKISIKFRLCINNIKSKTTTSDFDKVIGFGWHNMGKLKALKDLNSIIIELHMTILDIFDKNGNDITDYYNQKDLCIDLFSVQKKESKFVGKSWNEYVNDTNKQTTQIHNNRTVKSQFKKQYKVNKQEAETDALVNGYGNKKRNKKHKQKKKKRKKKHVIVFDYNLSVQQ
eukprot:361641_1